MSWRTYWKRGVASCSGNRYNRRQVRLLSWNVNGIRAAERKGFLDWLGKTGPDVMCLQETKASPDQLSPALQNIPSYTVGWDWAEKKGYSGVATYSKSGHNGMERGLGIGQYDREGRVMVTRFPEFTLYNIYFPNGKASPERLAYKLSFYEDLLKLLQARRKKGDKKVVICGDVNTAHREIDLARPKENRSTSGFLPEECAWMDRLLEAGFIDTFRCFEPAGGHYSWWDMQSRARERNVGWRIDYFFVSQELKQNLKSAFILPEVQGSDHCPVGIELEV